MEHGVYHCVWSRTPAGFVLCLKSRPWIKGEGSTYAAAEEQLITAIQKAGGAWQAVLEYDTPLPKSDLEAKYSSPELYLICGDVSFWSDAPRWLPRETAEQRECRFKWIDEFFQSPICRKCWRTAGPRTDKLLPLGYLSSGYDGAFGNVGNQISTNLQIVSGEFLDLLNSRERRRLELQPVTRKRGVRKFYELVGPSGPPLVAVSGLPVRGWYCTACGHKVWGYWIEGMAIGNFVARSDLPHPLPGLFTVGLQPEVSLCVTAERWHQLVKRRGTRGFVSRQLGVVPEHEVIRSPKLPTQEQASRANQRKWRKEKSV